MKKLLSVLSLLIIFSMLVAACGGEDPTPAPEVTEPAPAGNLQTADSFAVETLRAMFATETPTPSGESKLWEAVQAAWGMP